MASLNKDSSQKDILDDEINIFAVNVRPNISEVTNATMMDLTQTFYDKYTLTNNVQVGGK